MLDFKEKEIRVNLFLKYFWDKVAKEDLEINNWLRSLEYGYGIFFLGGAVRNHFLGINIFDFDIMVESENLNSILVHLKRKNEINFELNKNGGLRFKFNSFSLDIWASEKSWFFDCFGNQKRKLERVSNKTILNIFSPVIYSKATKHISFFSNFDNFLASGEIDFNEKIALNLSIISKNHGVAKLLARGIHFAEYYNNIIGSEKITVSDRLRRFYLNSINSQNLIFSEEELIKNFTNNEVDKEKIMQYLNLSFSSIL